MLQVCPEQQHIGPQGTGQGAQAAGAERGLQPPDAPGGHRSLPGLGHFDVQWQQAGHPGVD